MINVLYSHKDKNKNYELAQKFLKWRRVKQRNYNYLRNYQITSEEVYNLKKAQDHCCAICKQPFEGSKKTHVDHNHFTMKIRGVLCVNCNLGLGNFRDNILSLENAVKYLKEKDG